MKHPLKPELFVRWKRTKGLTPWHYSAAGALFCGRAVADKATTQTAAPPDTERVCASCLARADGAWKGGRHPRTAAAVQRDVPPAPETLTTPAARAAFLDCDLIRFAEKLPKARWGAIHGVATTVRELITNHEAFRDARQVGRATQVRMWGTLLAYGLQPGMTPAALTAWCNGEGATPAHTAH